MVTYVRRLKRTMSARMQESCTTGYNEPFRQASLPYLESRS
ncbi:hypothetical protein HDF10_004299 [Edaphobacter lichenicola]|uniref:Uncharacterized protein n=1 Tax=Tunturiibacter lichenicola TaxID=2051959 RepID=A0A7W8JEA4_9BACT|nr:hypothetical protein [Edaphobacter lichenicola]